MWNLSNQRRHASNLSARKFSKPRTPLSRKYCSAASRSASLKSIKSKSKVSFDAIFSFSKWREEIRFFHLEEQRDDSSSLFIHFPTHFVFFLSFYTTWQKNTSRKIHRALFFLFTKGRKRFSLSEIRTFRNRRFVVNVKTLHVMMFVVFSHGDVVFVLRFRLIFAFRSVLRRPSRKEKNDQKPKRKCRIEVTLCFVFDVLRVSSRTKPDEVTPFENSCSLCRFR